MKTNKITYPNFFLLQWIPFSRESNCNLFFLLLHTTFLETYFESSSIPIIISRKSFRKFHQKILEGSPLYAVSLHADSQQAVFYTNILILTRSRRLLFSYQNDFLFCFFVNFQSLLTIHASGFRKINHENLKWLNCVHEW